MRYEDHNTITQCIRKGGLQYLIVYDLFCLGEQKGNAMTKKYEELGFTDDFMFCKVLTTNPDLCHELLELIIGRKVGKFTRLDDQKPIELTADGKGVRFDVYSEDDSDTVFDCEMQATENRNLPKRSRYYQGMIDLHLIERGEDYMKLKKSYVIFICPFDAFKAGLHKYTFENICKELPEISLGDETTKIFLCAGGCEDDVSDDMKDFLDWISGKSEGKSSLVKGLDEAVHKARNHEEWRLEYMTLLMRDQEMREEGREEGREQQARTTALKLSQKGNSIEDIADIVGYEVETVKLWLENTH